MTRWFLPDIWFKVVPMSQPKSYAGCKRCLQKPILTDVVHGVCTQIFYRMLHSCINTIFPEPCDEDWQQWWNSPRRQQEVSFEPVTTIPCGVNNTPAKAHLSGNSYILIDFWLLLMGCNEYVHGKPVLLFDAYSETMPKQTETMPKQIAHMHCRTPLVILTWHLIQCRPNQPTKVAWCLQTLPT